MASKRKARVDPFHIMAGVIVAAAVVLGGAVLAVNRPLAPPSPASVALLETNTGFCTAFFVAPRLLATAGHCVEKPGQAITVTLRDGRQAKGYAIFDDDANDVAIIAIQGVTAPEVASLRCDGIRPSIGEPIWTVGNPMGLLPWFVSHGTVAGYGPTKSPGYDVHDYLWMGITIASGNSGGPVFDTSGRVVGVVSALAGERFGFAVPLASICQELGLA